MPYLVYWVSDADAVTLVPAHAGVAVEEVGRGDEHDALRGLVNDAEGREERTAVLPPGERLSYQVYADDGGPVPEDD